MSVTKFQRKNRSPQSLSLFYASVVRAMIALSFGLGVDETSGAAPEPQQGRLKDRVQGTKLLPDKSSHTVCQYDDVLLVHAREHAYVKVAAAIV
jgi:hypothetical protein